MNRTWKEALLAWSLMNLLFFRHWARILPGVHDYFLHQPHPALTYLSLMGLILILAAIAYALVVLVRRSGHPRLIVTARVVFTLLALFGVYSIIVEGWVLLGRPRFALWVRFIPIVLLVAGIVWLQRRHPGWHRKIVPVAVAVIMVLVPLAPIMYAQGLYHTLTPDEPDRFDPQPGSDVQGPGSPHRLVWIVFDELDQRLLYEERPEGVALPELDRLRDESLYATQAYAPSDATLRSVPAMTTGRLVDKASPRSLDGLVLDFTDGKDSVRWKETETVFSQQHEQGRSVGIVGTYHPYCRLFAEWLTECTFAAHHGPHETRFGPTLGDHLEGLRLAIPTATAQRAVWDLTGLTESVNEQRQEREIEKYQVLQRATVDAAADPDLDLAFLHLNVPHPTGMRGTGRGYYDAENGQFATGTDVTYYDNLALADRSLAEIRSAMETEGLWNETTVVITSDHGYRHSIWGRNSATTPYGDLLHRPTDHRVAFLVKPANSTQTGTQYDEPFNLVLMPELVQTALQDGFQSPAGIAAWLDAHPTIGPAPYYKAR